MTHCARCQWQPTSDDALAPRLQLVEHARDSAHPLCVVCARSLPLADRQTCETCLTRSREHLAGIALMYAELPRTLGHVKATAYDNDRPAAADGRPLPGGDALVLLAAGSEGTAEDGVTSRDGDVGSVAFELGWWHEDWQDRRGERVADRRPRSASAVVRLAVGYLEVHARWAATSHPGFDEYAADIAKLHGRLERATGRVAPTVRAEAECFACGADALLRKDAVGTACPHTAPPRYLPPWPGPVPCTVAARREEHRRNLDAWETAHQQCRQGGAEDQWTCGRCGEIYDWARYLLACRAKVETGRDLLRTVGWGTVAQVAAATGTPVETVKTWAKRGAVGTACLVASQQLLVWYADADQRATRARRTRRAG